MYKTDSIISLCVIYILIKPKGLKFPIAGKVYKDGEKLWCVVGRER